MSLRIIIGGVSFALAMSGVLVGNLSYHFMIEEINKERPIDQKISNSGFTSRLNSFDHINEYRNRFPASSLYRKYWYGLGLMIVGMISVVCCFMAV
jgi:hypothetical protein